MSEAEPIFDPNAGAASNSAPNPLWAQLRESAEWLGAAGQRARDGDSLTDRLARRAQLLRPPVASETPGPALMCLGFNKGRRRYGIPVEHVREVQAIDRFTPAPRTPAFLAGVIHWRGAILTLLDLGALIGAPEAGISDVHACVIVEVAGRRIGVIAYEVEEVYSLTPSSLAVAPPLPGALPPEWLLGVHDHERMILNMAAILDDARLVSWIKRA